ncbi:serine/threonine protein kinase [Ktedonospora formicarum]|uniref:non-specific serine/threonine protein kinase n=1 Tax=Ktedonospora formicarum TaxID=2778364 RepID=A0A8J3I2L9_9CHLR|nr:serine/threonine-protein kinase [Ktedonospora formicarum]GHO45660.1 hypothetical protein KSX_38230 [Ktedonospora formicarum]
MPQDALIGKQIGAYQIKSAIGEGGMARVYKAYHERLQRDVALKVILPHLRGQDNNDDETAFIERFKREALLVARLEHPNIVAVYDFGETNADPQGNRLTYLVMQYVGGGTLRTYMRDGQALDPRRAARYTLQMARALHHAHRNGIVHRDIKPQNMLVSASDPNHLLLSDFGIAKLFSTSDDAPLGHGSQANAHPALTQIGQVIGTAAYMAPEQFNNQQVDARTDIYALGIVLYQMLAGRRPFEAENLTGYLYQHLFQAPPPIRTLNPQIPDILELITYKALEKQPEQRFQNAEEMAQALEDALPALTQPSSSYSHFPLANSSAQTLPSQPSVQPTHPNYSTIEGHSSPGLYGPVNATSLQQSNTTPVTMPGSLSQIPSYQTPIAPRPVQRSPLFRLSTIATAVIIILALVLIGTRVLPLLNLNLNQPSSQTAQAFTDNFADSNNPNKWVVGNLDSLNASLNNHAYKIVVNDTNTHFPNPQAVGKLPENFTWTITMRQDSGASDRFYGMAYHLTYTGQSVSSCYVFAIDGQGDYTILRYDSNNGQISYQTLWSAESSSALHQGLHQDNTLSVTAKGDTYSFKLNNKQLKLQDQQTTLKDNHYSAGLVGLMVTGASPMDATLGQPGFTTTYAQLQIA